MAIFINIILFLAIFGYAAYTLTRFFRRSKEGKCGTCDVNQCGCETMIEDKR